MRGHLQPGTEDRDRGGRYTVWGIILGKILRSIYLFSSHCFLCLQIYNRINDKVVGLLIRARKKELLTFSGEMLYQGKDDEEWIALTKSINSIREYFGRDGDIPGGGYCHSPRRHLLEEELEDIIIAPQDNVETLSEGLMKSEKGLGTPTEKSKNRLLNQTLRNSFRFEMTFEFISIIVFFLSLEN